MTSRNAASRAAVEESPSVPRRLPVGRTVATSAAFADGWLHYALLAPPAFLAAGPVVVHVFGPLFYIGTDLSEAAAIGAAERMGEARSSSCAARPCCTPRCKPRRIPCF